MNIHVNTLQKPVGAGLAFAWLEITGKCQLSCSHCYAESGPKGLHGVMTVEDWRRTIDDVAACGGRMVQFIGGEPTLHPAFPELVDHALRRSLEVEVFTNLVKVTPRLWQTFSREGVRVATSYYGSGRHDEMTGVSGSHSRTLRNVAECVQRGIALRVGVVAETKEDGAAAKAELEQFGVTDVNDDYVRGVGRGAEDSEKSIANLCGACGGDKIAIAPDGAVWPCVFARWLPIGNIKEAVLSDILQSRAAQAVEQALHLAFRARQDADSQCDPRCGPYCSPACSPQCSPMPCGPRGGCQPNYD